MGFKSILISILSFLFIVTVVFITIFGMNQSPMDASNETIITEQCEPDAPKDSMGDTGYEWIAVTSGFILILGTSTFMYLKKKNAE